MNEMPTATYVELVSASQIPIDGLPNEILGSIFYLNTFKGSNTAPSSYDPHATTLTTLLVCRRWHNIAINDPALWSRIIDFERHPPHWVNELLRRSRSSLFDVGEDSVFKYAKLQNARSKAVLGSIFQHTSRLRTLSIQIRLAPWKLISQSFLQYPAPNLEYLNLVTASPFPDCLFPDPLFVGDAPHLRRVHLQRCLIDFSSTVLSNLTELSVLDIVAPDIQSLRRPDHPLKVAPTVSAWLRILQNIPTLQYLTLSNAITPSENDEPTLLVHLHKLLFLTIGARFQEGVALLHHLSIPQGCGIRARFNRRSPIGSDGAKLLSFLSNQLSHWPEDSPNRYLQAKILSGDRIHFGNSKRVGYLWDMTEADVIAEHSSTCADPLVWLVCALDSSEDTTTLFNQLLSLYTPTYTTTTTLDLWIDEEYADPITQPLPFLSLSTLHSFIAVKTLNLLERSPLYLLPLFQNSSLPGQPLFPALGSLRLTGAHFDDDDATYQTIINFLSWRREGGMALTELQVIQSKISEDMKENLWKKGGVNLMLGSLGSKDLLSRNQQDSNV